MLVGGHFVVYDATCGPCSRFRRAVELLDTRHVLTFVSLGEADSSGLLSGVPPETRYSSFHLVGATPRGVASGASALPPLLGLLPLGRPAARLLEGAPMAKGAVGFLYSALSRLHASCASAPPRGRA